MKPTEVRAANPAFVFDWLRTVSIPARKLFSVIVREAYHGPMHPKPKGIATPPEILEACGLDVGEFYSLLNELKEAGLIRVSNPYPFEEIQLSPEAGHAETVAERCTRQNVPFEDAFVNLASPPNNRS